MKVSGFDHVPENLRSLTYKRAARAIIEAHFNFNNFFTEKPLVNNLSKLGSTIPAPALVDCMQAYLCVFLGNPYGASFEAAPLAKRALVEITLDRWLYYLGKVIQTDDIILAKLMNIEPAAQRFASLLNAVSITADNLGGLSGRNLRLVNSLLEGKIVEAQKVAMSMFKRLKSLASERS